MRITKTICGVVVYGYPCWDADVDYLKDENEIIEYTDNWYYNEKVLDITFDNTLYIHGMPPPNNPIFRLKGPIWREVTDNSTTDYDVGERLKVSHPTTNEDVFVSAKGTKRAKIFNDDESFNSDDYNLIFGDDNAACSVFNPISCADWTGTINNPSAAPNLTSFSFTDPEVLSSGLGFSDANDSGVFIPGINYPADSVGRQNFPEITWNRTFR